MSALVLVLVVACGNDDFSNQQQNHENPAPAHLLIRAPLSVDYPITLEESAESRKKPNIYGPEAMEPSQSFQYLIVVFDCCVVVRPVETDAEWSVAPVGIASIDAKTGFLVVDEAAAHGSVVTVTADVEGVDSPLARGLTVFSSKINPLIGRWREERASGGVRELLFQSDGLYAATWLLLESWMDLFGTYNVDTSTGKIEFIEDWERVETPEFQGQGDFRIDEDGTLLLSGICANEPNPDNPDCIRRFVRSI